MTKRRVVLFGLGAAVIGCAAVLAAFLQPSTPDLMAKATVIHDFGGPDKFDGFQWIDKSHLIATSVPLTPNPSIISIDINSKSTVRLPRVTYPLRKIMAKFHSDELTDAVLSPDGKWILFGFAIAPYLKCAYCVIRIADGKSIVGPERDWGTIFWLTDSHSWVIFDDRGLSVLSIDRPTKDRVFSSTGVYGRFIQAEDFKGLHALFGKEYVFEPRLYRAGRSSEEDGVVSPNGKRIAWLYESAWPRGLPFKLRPLLIACRYRPRLHGEVWTTRIDGTDRHEIGAFNDQSPFPIDEWNFDWAPDGKSLIFVRGGVLYSIPAR